MGTLNPETDNIWETPTGGGLNLDIDDFIPCETVIIDSDDFIEETNPSEREQIVELLNENRNLKKKNVSLREDLNKAEDVNECLERDLEIMKLSERESDYSELKTKYKKVKKELKEVKKIKDHLEGQLDLEIYQNKQEVSDYAMKLKVAEERATFQENISRSLQAGNDRREQELKDLGEIIEQMSQELKERKETLEARDNEIEELYKKQKNQIIEDDITKQIQMEQEERIQELEQMIKDIEQHHESFQSSVLEELNKIDGQQGFDRNRLSQGHPRNILRRLRKISNSFDGMFNVDGKDANLEENIQETSFIEQASSDEDEDEDNQDEAENRDDDLEEIAENREDDLEETAENREDDLEAMKQELLRKISHSNHIEFYKELRLDTIAEEEDEDNSIKDDSMQDLEIVDVQNRSLTYVSSVELQVSDVEDDKEIIENDNMKKIYSSENLISDEATNLLKTESVMEETNNKTSFDTSVSIGSMKNEDKVEVVSSTKPDINEKEAGKTEEKNEEQVEKTRDLAMKTLSCQRKSGILGMFRSVAFDLSEESEDAGQPEEEGQPEVDANSKVPEEVNEEYNVLFSEQEQVPSARNSTLTNIFQAQGRRKMSTDTSSDKETSFDERQDTFSSSDLDLDGECTETSLGNTEANHRTRRISLQEEYFQENRETRDKLEHRRLSLLSDFGQIEAPNNKKRWTLSIRHDIMDALRKEMDSEEEQAFPSLNSDLMESLELEKEGPGVSRLSDQEIEKKFALLSLAMKEDKDNLSHRLASHGRIRDSQERKLEDAVYQIKANLSGLLAQGGSGSFIDILRNILKQLQVFQQSISRLSGTSEAVGAVKQESKVAYAVEVYIRHVDKLKTKQEKEQRDLDEFRKMLNSMGDIQPATIAEKEIDSRRVSTPVHSSTDTQNKCESSEESGLRTSVCLTSSQDSSSLPENGEVELEDEVNTEEGNLNSFIQKRFLVGWLAEIDLDEVNWELIERNAGKILYMFIALLSLLVLLTFTVQSG